jgi:hypothetical protein
MRSTFPAVLALAALSLGGCASIVKGTSQSISVSTPPTTGAQCTLSSSEGTWLVISPGNVTVPKSKSDIAVRCVKPGWQPAVATIPSGFAGMTAGNILLGGVVGLGIDAATGAIHQYPHSVQVPMTVAVPTRGTPTS